MPFDASVADGGKKGIDRRGDPNTPRASHHLSHRPASSSIAWSLAREAPRLATASWDGTVKVWDPLRPDQPLAVFEAAHGGGYVYQARWSPHRPGLLLSAGADGAVRVWDVRQRDAVVVSKATCGLGIGGQRARRGPDALTRFLQRRQSLLQHQDEALTCDWDRYEGNHVISGGIDRQLIGARGAAADVRTLVPRVCFRHPDPPAPHSQGMTCASRPPLASRWWGMLWPSAASLLARMWPGLLPLAPTTGSHACGAVPGARRPPLSMRGRRSLGPLPAGRPHTRTAVTLSLPPRATLTSSTRVWLTAAGTAPLPFIPWLPLETLLLLVFLA